MVASSGKYARKHNPFVFFDSLRASGQCQANDVGLDQLAGDLQSSATTPNLSFIVPNQCNDGHDACPSSFPIGNPITDDQDGLRQIDAFLRKWVPQITASPAYKQDGLLIVTFDEAVETTACCNEQPGPADPNPGSYVAGMPAPGGGNTGTVLLSPFVEPGSVNINEYNHYSLLRSLEDLFGVSHLGYAGQDGLQPFGADVFGAS
jgi:phosphatidylinositol-3-phosphatase